MADVVINPVTDIKLFENMTTTDVIYNFEYTITSSSSGTPNIVWSIEDSSSPFTINNNGQLTKKENSEPTEDQLEVKVKVSNEKEYDEKVYDILYYKQIEVSGSISLYKYETKSQIINMYFVEDKFTDAKPCLLYTSPSPRDH